MKKPLILIKSGGRAAEDSAALEALAAEMKNLSGEFSFLFVHGGGAAVSAIQKVYGIEPVFRDGIRITSPKEMDLVDMGLAGLMNKKLVRIFSSCGLKPVGLSGADGNLFTGKSIGEQSRTGRIVSTDPSLTGLLMEKGYTPVVCSVSSDRNGVALNINADEAALALGVACGAESIIFISDIPGILDGGRLRPELSEKEITGLIGDGIISGGMIPKVRSSLEALKSGAGTVVIGDYRESGDLKGLLTGKKGTKICLK